MMDRRRKLIILGSAALVSVALAGVAMQQRAAQGESQFAPTAFLPGFSDNVKNAALIHVASNKGAFDVTYTAEKGWVLPDIGNYPADFEEVRHTLIGLASLQTIMPKTARADWLHHLSLDAPPKGAGTEITVKDAKGAVLASVITGKSEELGDSSGATGLFVRKPGDSQAWYARAVFAPHGDINNWVSTRSIELGTARLQEVAMTPPSGPAFTVSRPNPGEQIYNLAAAPKKGMPNSIMINSIPYSVGTFSFTQVQPVAKIDFSKTSQAIARTFTGLLVSIDLTQQGPDVWAKVSASTAPGAAEAVLQEAAAINARTGGWAYKLPPEKGRALTTDLAKIMTPPPPPPGMPGMGGMPPGYGGAP